MHPQSEDFYNNKMTEYDKQKSDGEKVLKTPQSKKAAQLSRKELLDGLIHTIKESDMLIEKFDERHGD